MKKVIAILLISSSVYMYAGLFGFFGDVASTAIGGSLAKSGSKVVYIDKLKKRADKVNNYLWHMHEIGKYDKSYKFYLTWLEKYLESSGFDDINYLDTIARVYKDNGNKKKAIYIYETRIIPWVELEYKDKKFQQKWKKYYDGIKK